MSSQTRSCLKDTHPHLFAELHPARNADLIDDDVASFSNKKVWWVHRDEVGSVHEWRQIVRNRAIEGSGCSTCARLRRAERTPKGSITPAPGRSLAERHPEHAARWHPEWNGMLTPRDVSAGSERGVWWLCAHGHPYVRAVKVQTKPSRKTSCPVCIANSSPVVRRRSTSNLAEHDPETAAQWHPTKNGGLTPADVWIRDPRKIWWKCANRHVWSVSPRTRFSTPGRVSGCPKCAAARRRSNFAVANGQRTRVTLAERSPAVAAEWHPTRNNDKSPRTIAYGSAFEAWWRCERGHEWRMAVNRRTTGNTGCWVCAHPDRSPLPEPVTVERSLATVAPSAAAQWHPVRNGTTSPNQVAATSTQKVWLRCAEGHDIHTSARAAADPSTGCRPCSNRVDRARRAQREAMPTVAEAA